MKIDISNRQRGLAVDRQRLTALTKHLMQRADGADPARRWAQTVLVLVDDARIRAINRRVFGKDEVTDVISICYPPVPGEEGGFAAEIVVNVQRAAAQAASHGRWSTNRELALYIAHGCDHCAGADDNTPRKRRRMRRRELRWLQEASERQLLGALTRQP
jgi:rRNA maturation RNase YbeY